MSLSRRKFYSFVETRSSHPRHHHPTPIAGRIYIVDRYAGFDVLEFKR